MKHDVSLSHDGGELSLGLLKKEKTALPCNEVSHENPQFLKNLNFFRNLWQPYFSPLRLGHQSLFITTLCLRYVSQKKLSTPSSQGEIVKSDRMVVTVGGSDAMTALVEGTIELAATDGQGDAGEFQFQSFSLCAKSKSQR